MGIARRIVLGLLTAIGTTAEAGDRPPRLDWRDIEEVLERRVSNLAKSKTADGHPLARGVYSRTPRAIGDGRYAVVFHEDRLEWADGLPRSAKTIRSRLTLAKNPKGRWIVADEEATDEYAGLRPILLDSGVFRPFDGISFEREGLVVTGGRGGLLSWSKEGRVVALRAVAEGLAFRYEVPNDLPQTHYRHVFRRIREKHPEDVSFEPETLRLIADADSMAELLNAAFRGLGDPRPIEAAGDDPMLRSLRRSHDDDLDSQRENLREDPFSPFAPPDDPDRRYVHVLVDRKVGATPRMFGLSHDNAEPLEVRVRCGGYGPSLFAYNSEAVRRAAHDLHELEAREDLADRTYDVEAVRGTVELAIESPESMRANLEFTIVAKRPLDKISFSVSQLRTTPFDAERERRAPRLFLNSVEDGDGNELTFVRLGPASAIILLRSGVPAGARFVLRVGYDNPSSFYVWNYAYSYLSRLGWLPFVRYGDVLDAFDLTVETPTRYTPLSVGRRVRREERDGRSITQWATTAGVDFPTVVIGQYDRDEPPIRATKSDGTAIPVAVYMDKVTGTWFPTGKLRPIGEKAVNALNIFREAFGVDYPFDKLDLVADPFGWKYGQAPASIIYLGAGVFTPEDAFIRDVIAHEVAHQWWGSLVGAANDRNYWFIESLAEYSAAIFTEAVHGEKAYRDKVEDWRRRILRSDLVAPVQSGYSTWTGEGGNGGAANLYAKGPFVFHVLRKTFGDEPFFAFLKRLAQTRAHQTIVTRDIQRAAEEVYGFSLDFFFEQWIRGIGIPEFTVSYTSVPGEDGGWIVSGTIGQRVVFGRERTPLPDASYWGKARIVVETVDGREFRSAPVVIDGPEVTFRTKVPVEPVRVDFNRDREILAHDVRVREMP